MFLFNKHLKKNMLMLIHYQLYG